MFRKESFFTEYFFFNFRFVSCRKNVSQNTLRSRSVMISERSRKSCKCCSKQTSMQNVCLRSLWKMSLDRISRGLCQQIDLIGKLLGNPICCIFDVVLKQKPHRCVLVTSTFLHIRRKCFIFWAKSTFYCRRKNRFSIKWPRKLVIMPKNCLSTIA